MSLQALRSKVKVTSPAVGILSFSAKGRTAAQAEATANAVAKSYTAFVLASHPAGRVYRRTYSTQRGLLAGTGRSSG